jgi:hypothetical protein
MVTTELVIARMNELARGGAEGIPLFAEDDVPEREQEQVDERRSPAVHVPIDPVVVTITEAEGEAEERELNAGVNAGVDSTEIELADDIAAATDAEEIENTEVEHNMAEDADQASYGEQRIEDTVPDVLVEEFPVQESPVMRSGGKVRRKKKPGTIAEQEQSTEHPAENDARKRTEEQVVLPTRQSARLVGKQRINYRAVPYSFNTSVKKGLRENGAAAYDAIKKEFMQLFKDKKALVPVKKGELSRTQIKKILRSSMFLKTKFDARGIFEKIKARLVADGRMQDRALYPDNSSPTVAMQSLMMTLLIAATENRNAMKIDIGGAYLNAEMTGEEVLMELDRTLSNIVKRILPEVEQFVENGKLVVRLDRALYGCVQSAKLWFEKLTDILKGMGFVPNEVDPCVMNLMRNGKQLTLAIYVDDILALSENAEDLEWFREELEKVFDDVKAETGGEFSYLGMHIILEKGKARISMKQFIEELLDLHGEVRMRITPATNQLFESDEEKKLNDEEKGKFHTMVAKLLYLSKRTRSDIALPVIYLCTRVKSPTEEDKRKLDRVMGYLKMTKSRELVLTCKGAWRVTGFIDAAFGCHLDGKSHSGGVICVGGACILVISRKQKIVTKDSTEAELVALSDLITAVEKCEEFMVSQGMCDMELPVVFQDNTSTISLVTKGGGKPRTKHMRVRQQLVKEKFDHKEIDIQYVKTREMLADVLTKPLGGELFRWMTGEIMGKASGKLA